MANIFADLHHAGLFESFRLTFEERLGHQLFCPVGMEWFDDHWWNIGDPYGATARQTAQQYLDLDRIHSVKEFSREERVFKFKQLEDGIYFLEDPYHGTINKGITLEKFKKMDIDFVISSIPAHDATYEKLVAKYHPKSKHIGHVGNTYQQSHCKNVMYSTRMPPGPDVLNSIHYHQEFDTSIFKPGNFLPNYNPWITSFVHLFPQKEIFYAVEKELPEFVFKAYGAGAPLGALDSIHKLATNMGMTQFVWNLKPGGDGFGHLWHNAFCMGKPIICDISQYKDSMPGALFVDGRNGINIGGLPPKAAAAKIRQFSEPEDYQKMSHYARLAFELNVDYAKEADLLKNFLERCI